MTRRTAVAALLVLAVCTIASAQTVGSGPELYPGEKALYEAASKEGLVVSFDTGPTWANWAAQFAAFKKRYPEVEMTYNDLGSAATVVALEKARNRPQADTAYYFAASAVDAAKKDVVAPFKPVNFDKLPEVFRHPEGKWFTIHSLTVAFLVNTKLIKNVPQSWADLLKSDYKNSVVYLDPRSTGQGQVLMFAANFAAGGDMNNVQPGIDYMGKLHKAGNVLRVVGTILTDGAPVPSTGRQAGAGAGARAQSVFPKRHQHMQMRCRATGRNRLNVQPVTDFLGRLNRQLHLAGRRDRHGGRDGFVPDCRNGHHRGAVRARCSPAG